jgi:molecular chaperone GrpE
LTVAEQKEIQTEEEEAALAGADDRAGEESTTEDPGLTAPAPESSELEQLQQELEAARDEARVNLDKAVRAHAEMENLRKRTARDIENAHKYALDKFVAELLPVLDSMELGLAAADTAGNVDSLREGIDLTLKKFQNVLEKFGIDIIDPQGEKFDPDRHEAVSMQELKGAESGTVVSVMQKGYELNGRLVRPAMVIVAK